MPRHHTPLFLSIAAAAGLLPAQNSEGPTIVIAHAFAVDGATAIPGAMPNMVLMTHGDFSDTAPPAPPPPPSPGQPDFSTLFGGAPIDVDAISLGYDWVVSDPTGTVAVPPGSWAAITFSVRRTTLGAPGSLIATEVARPDGAAADVFGYVFPTSNLPPAWVGVPFRSQDSGEIAAWFGAPPQGNIDAHDIFIGILYGDNPLIAATLPPPTVYFSVTSATAPTIPLTWTAIAGLRNGATVFATTWDPLSMTWSVPFPAFDASTFGISATEDLDALALDLVHGRVLFSTDGLTPPPAGGPRNQVLYSNLGSGTNTTYRLPGGTPVTTAIGLGIGPDDIDAICALDPGTTTNPSQVRLERMVSSMGNRLFPAPTQLDAVAYRRAPGFGQEHLVSLMAGWPPPGTPGPPFSGIAVCAVAIGPAPSAWTTSNSFLRADPANYYFRFDGHPHKHIISVPPSFSGINVPFWFVWGAAGPGGFDLTYPVSITL
jgi:hypothetical protein